MRKLGLDPTGSDVLQTPHHKLPKLHTEVPDAVRVALPLYALVCTPYQHEPAQYNATTRRAKHFNKRSVSGQTYLEIAHVLVL